MTAPASGGKGPCVDCGAFGLHHPMCASLAPPDWCPSCLCVAACDPACPTLHPPCVCGPDHDCRATGCADECEACNA